MSFKLRDYQEEAVSNVINDLQDHNRVVLIGGTGMGKTETFIEIAKRFTASYSDPGSVLVLSHLDILTTQTAARFALRAPELRVGIMKGCVRPHVLAKVVIATMQSARMKGKAEHLKQRLLRPPKLIIVDECHHILTESYRKIFSYFPEAKVVGCTATPFCGDKIMTNFFDKVSFSISLQELIDMGFLVPPKLFEFPRSGDELEDVIASVVSTYKERENGKGAIVFMKTMADAKALRNTFVDQGISAEAITSKIVGEPREKIIERFNVGDIKVLTTVNVLTEGFDAGRVQSIFLPYATNSPSYFVQRVGRGLRTAPEIGKDHCSIHVFGRMPSISKRLYEKAANLALNMGQRKIKEYSTVTETFDYNNWEPSDPKYTWTKTEFEAVKRMEKLGMNTFSKMLNERRFPKRFLNNIKDLLAKLPNYKSSLPHGDKPVTENQKAILFKYGFQEKDMTSVSKSEASTMISAILGKTNSKWTVKSGRFAGRNVFELPFSYRDYIIKNMPNSEVGQLIQSWRTRNEPMDSKANSVAN